jgi:hypothetical protein
LLDGIEDRANKAAGIRGERQRPASLMVRSTAQVSRLMSNRCSPRRCAPATSSSWITSARIKAARSVAPFAHFSGEEIAAELSRSLRDARLSRSLKRRSNGVCVINHERSLIEVAFDEQFTLCFLDNHSGMDRPDQLGWDRCEAEPDLFSSNGWRSCSAVWSGGALTIVVTLIGWLVALRGVVWLFSRKKNWSDFTRRCSSSGNITSLRQLPARSGSICPSPDLRDEQQVPKGLSPSL